MGFIGAVIIFTVLVFSFSNRPSGGDLGDKIPPWFAKTLALLHLGVFIFIILLNIASNYAYIYLYFLACLMCAGFMARFFSHWGWYRSAYFLGRVNVFRIGRNSAAMDIYRGYIAAKQLKQTEKQREVLLWLRSRYYRRLGKIYSGEMVMYLIIDSHLTHPNDTEYLAARLIMLKGIGTASIPGPISVLGLKYSLLPALSHADWPTINDIADQWNTPANNYLAKFLNEFYGSYILEQSMYSRFKCWLLGLFLWRHRELVDFAKRSAEVHKQATLKKYQLSPKALLRAYHNNAIEEKSRKKILHELIGESAKMIWLARAEELGVHRAEDVWKAIERSVHQCPGLKRQSEFVEDDIVYEYIEKRQINLRYVEASIARKLDKKMKGPALDHYLDWLQVLQILNELKANKYEKCMAFSMVHGVIMSWVADLWNIRKERCLAHFIAKVCAPLAYECGIHEMGNKLIGITIGKYR